MMRVLFTEWLLFPWLVIGSPPPEWLAVIVNVCAGKLGTAGEWHSYRVRYTINRASPAKK